MNSWSCLRPCLPGVLGFFLLPAVVAAAGLDAAERQVIDRAEKAILALEKDRQSLLAQAHLKEQECLRRFASAGCLEDLRQSVTAASRDLDLAAEALREGVRRTQANARQRARDTRSKTDGAS
jgi:hypothetical protein